MQPCPVPHVSCLLWDSTQTGGSWLPPPSPLTFTLQYNYLTHSRESFASWVLVVFFFFFPNSLVNISQESIFLWGLVSMCALFMETPDWLQPAEYETDLCWPPAPTGPGCWLRPNADITAVNRLLVWLMHSLMWCVCNAHLWHTIRKSSLFFKRFWKNMFYHKQSLWVCIRSRWSLKFSTSNWLLLPPGCTCKLLHYLHGDILVIGSTLFTPKLALSLLNDLNHSAVVVLAGVPTILIDCYSANSSVAVRTVKTTV